MARTRTMAKAAAKAKSDRDAAQLQAHIEARAYSQLTDAQLAHECEKRLLWPFTRYHMLEKLKGDDEQRAALSANEYAAVLFARSDKLPPYRFWDRALQVDRVQQQPDYDSRLADAQKAVSHNDTLKPSLMTLPPELRNLIYFDLFTSAPGIVQNHRTHPFVLTHENDSDNRIFFGHEHALLRTCKAIRIDALPIWYGNREYRFTQSRTHLKTSYDNLTFPFQLDQTILAFFEKWASLLGDGRLDMIRHLHFELDCVIFTIDEGIVDVYKLDSLSTKLKVKDVPAVGKAIWKVLGKYMDTTKLKASKSVAEYLQGALAMEGVEETEGLVREGEDLARLLAKASNPKQQG